MMGVAVGGVVAVGKGDGVVWITAVVGTARVTSDTPIGGWVDVAKTGGVTVTASSADWQLANTHNINNKDQVIKRINNSQ